MCKNILITGTSSGIGFCCAKLLADCGYVIFAGVRTQRDFEKLQSISANIKPIFLDVLNSESVDNAVQELKDKNVELDVVINNAGAVVAQPIECINIDDLRYQFEINTIAPVRIAQAFLPLMGSGKIINISSMASSGIFPYIAPYCASKRALDILFNSLSIELKNKNIKIISVKPGSIKTPIWNKSIENNQKSLDKIPVEFKNKYEKDLIFLAQNADRNNYKATEPIVVAKKILKIIRSKQPKSSYCVGLDSHLACAVGKLPQDILNKIIKFQLKRKLKRCKMNNIFSRNIMYWGEDVQQELTNKHVFVFGLGGVGGYCAEALARSGVGELTIVDFDDVSESNINRQLVALHSTIGKKKTDLFEERLKDINPNIKINAICDFYSKEKEEVFFRNIKPDCVIDAIDTMRAKVDLLTYCAQNKVPTVTSLGAGNRLDPTQLYACDISEIGNIKCDFTKNVLYNLKKNGISDGIVAVLSKERSKKPLIKVQSTINLNNLEIRKYSPSSTPFVPPVVGYILAFECLKVILKNVDK